jgi:hypothetical protein
LTEQKPASATPEQLHQQRVEAKDGGTVQNVVQVGDNHQGDIILNAIQRVRFDYANRIRNFLTEYLGTSEQPVPFGGREREMTLLNHWLSNATLPPYALLAAPAGRGKSALLVRWLQTLDPNAVRVAFVPVSIRYNTASSNVVFAALAAQLADIYDKSLPQSFHNWLGDQWRDLCLNYLSQPIPKDKKVLVILDGLDEATDWQAGADLFPTVSPSNLRVLVSARFLGGDDDTVGWLTRLGWERQGLVQTIELPTLTAIGVRAVLATMGNPLDALAERDYIVKELFRLSEGDPLLIGLYVKALMPFGTEAAALQPEELPQIKDGLIGYFNRWWKEQRLFWGEGSPLREPGVKSLLNILAIALGPLTREDILAIVPPEVELDSWILIEAIQTMQRFVVGDGKENGYSFSHPKLAQYFYSQLTLNEQIQWENRFLAYGQMQLKTLNGNKLASKSASSYMIQHYGLHLERAKAESKKFYALVSQGWQIAWFALDATYSGFLEDVRRAWERAEQEYNLANIIKCALCQATIVTLSDNIPPQLFALALIHRLLSPRQTLILIAQVSDDNKRSQSIQAVLPYLTSNHFNDVLVIARQIRDERSQAEALIVLVNYLPSVEHEGVLREVLLTISQIQYEPWRAEAIVKITPHLPPTMLHEAVDITRKISLMRSRVIALAELIPYLPYKEQASSLSENPNL